MKRTENMIDKETYADQHKSPLMWTNLNQTGQKAAKRPTTSHRGD